MSLGTILENTLKVILLGIFLIAAYILLITFSIIGNVLLFYIIF